MRLVIASLLAALTVLAIGGFAFLWQSERAKHHDAARNLDQANVQVDNLKASEVRLTGELASAQEIAAKRAAVLKRANKVLRGVEPLLSSVDELKSIAGQMSTERDNFASDTSTLVDDLVTLANYLLEPGENDYAYVNNLIDEINSKLANVREGADSLNTFDGDYSAASSRFDGRATALTKSIRALERQLKLVTR
jgi:hypothetical protein